MIIIKTTICHAICVLAALSLAVVLPGRAWGQQVSCEGTRQAWLADRSLQGFMSKHHCSCSNGPSRMPVCVPRGGGGGGSDSPAPAKKKYSGTKALQHAAIQGLAAGLAAGLLMNLFAAPSTPAPGQQATPSSEPTPEQRQKWAEAAQKAKEQMDAVDRTYKEHRAQQSAAAISQLKGSLKGRPESIPAEVQRERASKAIDQLSCSAFFGLEAADHANKRDGVKAKHYGDLAALAAIGDMPVDCPRPPPKNIPEVPGPLSEIPQVQLYELISEEIKDAATEVETLHVKKEQAEQKIFDLQAKIKDLQTQLPALPISEKESPVEDPLLAEAQKALADALKEKSEADLGLIQKEKEIEAYRQMYARYEVPAK
ncbi:MAG TPA: hypothetical protein VLR50_01515 [Desulfobacterales bacterium]|nr:hypothetical protein [Desulfobacterales bacterium]